jgi:hypothetical protein
MSEVDRIKIVARRGDARQGYVIPRQDADDVLHRLRADGWTVRVSPLAPPKQLNPEPEQREERRGAMRQLDNAYR